MEEHLFIELMKRGENYFKEGRYALASEEFRKALEIDPQNVKALNNYGISLAEQGLLEHAIEIFQKALKLEPNNEKLGKNLALAVGNLCSNYIQEGKIEKAINLSLEIMQLLPLSPLPPSILGMLYSNQGEKEKAREFLGKAITLCEESEEYTLLAKLKEELNNLLT